MLPSCTAADSLKAAMLQRAYDLLWDGDALGCDTILEFIQSKDADAMLDAWSNDFDNDHDKKADKSKWYTGKVAA